MDPDDLFVPLVRPRAGSGVGLEPLPAPGFEGPLYRMFPWPAILGDATVSVGIAAAGVDHLVQLARTKTPAYQMTPLRDQQLAHYLAGKAQARVAAARDTIHRAAGDAYDEAQGSLLSWDTRLRLQLAVCFAAEASADAVRLVNEVAGTSAIRLERGFERYGATHTSSHITPPSPPTATLTAGRLIFGIDNEFPFLEL